MIEKDFKHFAFRILGQYPNKKYSDLFRSMFIIRFGYWERPLNKTQEKKLNEIKLSKEYIQRNRWFNQVKAILKETDSIKKQQGLVQ